MADDKTIEKVRLIAMEAFNAGRERKEKEIMSEDIFPCPSNCGSHRLVIHDQLGTFYARCNCGWEGPAMPTEKLAIDAWNTRLDSKPYKYAQGEELWNKILALMDDKAKKDPAVVASFKVMFMEAFNAARERKEG